MKMSSFKALAAVGLFLTLGALTPAAAQRADDMRGGGQNPCAPDAQRVCSQFIPDRAKVASCLFKNKAQLSSACRAELGGGSGKKGGKGKRHHARHHHHHH